MKASIVPMPMLAALIMSIAPPIGAQEEFAETRAIVEINATDGDAGFHVLLDGEGWDEVTIEAPNGEKLFEAEADGALREQGLTENFFESAEPLCAPDEEEPEAEVVPLSNFLQRFPPGEYRFSGEAEDGDPQQGTTELTHDLPAAPDIMSFDGTTITWTPGSDLGRCQDDMLIAESVIPNPADVAVVGWEVTVEPEDEDAADPLRVFRVQLPATASSVTVPAEFVNAYLDQGVTQLKVEVGAIEVSGNQTFSEETFELGAPQP